MTLLQSIHINETTTIILTQSDDDLCNAISFYRPMQSYTVTLHSACHAGYSV